MIFFRRAIPALFLFALLASAQQDRWQQSIDSGLRALAKPNYEEAEKQFQTALGQAQSLGPAQVSQTNLYLGLVYERQGQFDQAAAAYARATWLRERALGRNHVDVASGLEHQARVLRKLDRSAQADDLAARALQIRRDALRVKFPREVASERLVGVGGFRDGSTAAPQLIHRVEPEYSQEARLFRHDGTVEISIEVWPDGRAHNFDIRSGLGLGLDEKALDAVQQWRFRPAEKDGKPIVVSALVTVHFKLL